MAFTNNCDAISFTPQTTKDFPLFSHNSFAAIAICLSASIAFDETPLLPANFAILLYKLTIATGSCDGFIPSLTSALLPVIDNVDSN